MGIPNVVLCRCIDSKCAGGHADTASFLGAPHSRAALQISRAMLSFLFTYHQVMPAMLDFIFPFGKQIHAQDSYFGGFREESRLDVERRGPRIIELGRSGIELRMCYNLRSVERSQSDPELPWSIRQSAMYHSFDLGSGQSLWINVKGNELIKNRIVNTVTQPSSDSQSEAFSMALAAHLLFCDWSVENWRWYINYLENRIQVLAGNAVALDIEKPPSPPASPIALAKSPRAKSWNIPPPSRAGTIQSPSSVSTRWDITSTAAPSRSTTFNAGSQSRVAFDEYARSAQETTGGDILSVQAVKRGLASWKKSGGLRKLWRPDADQEAVSEEPKTMPACSQDRPKPPEQPPSVDKDGDGGPQDKFTFRDLQCVQHIEDKVQEVLLVLKLNSEVLEQLREHYRYAKAHAEFPERYKADCKVDLERFDQRLLQGEKDYAMLHSRTETLLHLISNRKGLVSKLKRMSSSHDADSNFKISGILQYRGVKANENFARKAEYSASRMEAMTVEMHGIAKKTEQETVSMRVITTVTLFFLPATFIAVSIV